MKDLMMTPHVFRSLGLVAALLTASCQAVPPAPVAMVGVPSAAVLSGQAIFPGYAVRAESGDVTGQATVSLLDATGAACAAGVTDADGRFTLYRSTAPFAPEAGDVFSLLVTKRVGAGLGAPLLSMRTGLVRTADGWNSYTGATVRVNVATTALAKLAEQDPALSADTLMGQVTDGVIAPLPGHDAEALASLVAAVRESLTDGRDPAGAIVKRGYFRVTVPSDLAALAEVEILDGDLSIEGDESLGAIALPALKRITGQLTLNDGNSGLHDLRGLKNLERVGSVYLAFASGLENLSGLEKLAVVDGDLSIHGNDALTSLADTTDPDAPTGLVALERVGGSLSVTMNPSLTRLGFPALASVGGDLTLWGADQLGSLAGLEGLSEVPGDASITGAGLTDAGALTGLTRVGGKLTVSATGLADLTGLSGLTTAGELAILENEALTSLVGLTALTRVDGDVAVRFNPLLELNCLNPLGHPYTYGGSMSVVGNANACE